MTSLYDDLQKLIEKEARKAKAPSLLLSVHSGDGKIAFRSGIAAASDAPFYIASVTKMFTATLILQLQDQGMIDLDMNVQTLLPQYDLSQLHVINGHSFAAQLTVRQLLHQTSGLADYFEGEIASVLKQGQDMSYDLEDVLRISQGLKPQGRPDSGKSYYSDTNYQLLGAIIEAVTGSSYGALVQSQICAPLGMSQTTLALHKPTDDPAPLMLYNGSKPLHLPLALASMGADGAIISTLQDMQKFMRAYMNNDLFAPDNAVEVRRFQALFFPLQYGLGLMRFQLPRWMNLFRETPEFIGHSGASASFAFYEPQADIYIIGTYNQIAAAKRPIALMMKIMQLIKRHKTAV